VPHTTGPWALLIGANFVILQTEYRDNIPWGDQDILNVYFHDFPDEYHSGLTCAWNYRPDHCMFEISHGARMVIHPLVPSTGI
jgi:hypothetical protein